MQITYESINLLMLLMPGLIASRVFGLIRRKHSASAIEKMTESLIFAFIIYVALSLSYKWEPLAIATEVPGGIDYQFSTDPLLIGLTLIYSVFIPAIFGAAAHYDWHMRMLRKLRITDRTSRDTAWDDVFTDEKRFLTLHLKDGRRVTGWPLYYSNNKDEGFVYLSQAAWVNGADYIDTMSHGLLVHRDMIDYTEFMWNPDEEGRVNE